MRWGKHKSLKEIWQSKVTGSAYKRKMNDRAFSYIVNRNASAAQREYASNIKKIHNGNVAGSFHQKDYDQALSNSRSLNIESRRQEKLAYRMLDTYRKKSLKGITETKIAKAKAFIKSRVSERN